MAMYMLYQVSYKVTRENPFPQFRQMSGGRFLVSFCEVNNSERILLFEDVNFWMEDLSPDVLQATLDVFAKFVEENDSLWSYLGKRQGRISDNYSWLCWEKQIISVTNILICSYEEIKLLLHLL